MGNDATGVGSVVELRDRRSDHDVTNTVQVTSVEAVCDAVHDIFARLYPGASYVPVRRAFEDFETLFSGRMPGFLGCDTVYHDIQHTLDMTLAMARLVQGYETTHPEKERLGAARATLGLVTSLFHDAGYIRYADDEHHKNGAEFTRDHVTRSAHFLDRYLASNGLGSMARVARHIVHYTGYEVHFDQIHIENVRDRTLGHLMGTADLVAQMADRCYLEKCRDRLFPEFVLGGVAMQRRTNGSVEVIYRSGLELLRRTPEFYETVCRPRLEESFNGAYRYMEAVFDGRNPYMLSLTKNLFYLERILMGERWPLLRRRPPCVLSEQESLENMRSLVARRLRELRSDAA